MPGHVDRHDLRASDAVVGLVVGLSSLGGLAAAMAGPARRRFGFVRCWFIAFGLLTPLARAGAGVPTGADGGAPAEY